MKFRSLASLLPFCVASLAGPSAAADGFAAAGTRATLSVDYVYESAGRKQDRVFFGATVTYELESGEEREVTIVGVDEL